MLAKILILVRQNKLPDGRKVCSVASFGQGCLNFFSTDVLGEARPKQFVVKQAMELLKFFLDLRCSRKFASIAAHISNKALSQGEFKQRMKRQLGKRLNAPFISFRKAHVMQIAENDYASTFITYMQNEISIELIEQAHGQVFDCRQRSFYQIIYLMHSI